MIKLSSTILAIETSCDDTAISIFRSKKGVLELLTNEISSQTKLHAEWGGIVPNLAAREHLKNIFPLLTNTMQKAAISPQELDVIAVTKGPGLIPALLVGTSIAKTLAYLWHKPLIGIHHVEGHIYANFIGSISNSQFPKANPPIPNDEIQKLNNTKSYKLESNEAILAFPALCLVVSGGHTQLVLMKDHLQYEVVGQTLDDAAGEAFDKVARILNIGYPGGPAVSKYAAMYDLKTSSVKSYDLKFPRPLLNKNAFDFSFSGLKTAVLYETKKNSDLLKNENYIAEVCYEFQQAVVDVLVKKTIKAAGQYQPKTIMLAGGVSANKELRMQLGAAIKNDLSEVSYLVPNLAFTGDNAAMIATAAFFRWEKMSITEKEAARHNWETLVPDVNLKLQ